MTSDYDGNQTSGLTMQQSQFHRAQSVTSAVDYEYFDMGIGQVPHTHMITCARGYKYIKALMHHLPASLLPPLAWTDQWRHSQGTGVSRMVSPCSQALSLALFDLSVPGVFLHIQPGPIRENSRRFNYSGYFRSIRVSYIVPLLRLPSLSH